MVTFFVGSDPFSCRTSTRSSRWTRIERDVVFPTVVVPSIDGEIGHHQGAGHDPTFVILDFEGLRDLLKLMLTVEGQPIQFDGGFVDQATNSTPSVSSSERVNKGRFTSSDRSEAAVYGLCGVR